jgi:hypothetical protein
MVEPPPRAHIGSVKTRSSTPLIIGGALAALVALVALAAAAGLLWAHVAKNDQGYLTTHAHRLHTTSRALVSTTLTVDSAVPDWLLDQVRVDARGEKALFIGVARRADVDRYLDGVASTTVEDLDVSPFRVTYADHAGARTPTVPAAQRFWAASSSGDLRWHLEKGTWAVVLMNADGSPGVDADVSVGAKFDALLPAGIGFAVLGGLLAGLTAWLVRRGSRVRTL